jgi:hypothetical protein
MALIAGVLAILIVQLLLPAYSALVKKSLFIDYSNIYFWLASFGFRTHHGLAGGQLSGILPLQLSTRESIERWPGKNQCPYYTKESIGGAAIYIRHRADHLHASGATANTICPEKGNRV